MNKSKIFMIASICILCVTIIGSTVAYYRAILFNDLSVNTITHGLDYYINYVNGQSITAYTLSASATYSGGNSADVEFWKKDDTYDIYGHIYLDVNEIGTYSSASSALKYALVNGTTVISEGVLKGSEEGTSIPLKTNIPLETTEQLYTVYVWLDEAEEPDNNMTNETLSLTIRCEATMEPIAVE